MSELKCKCGAVIHTAKKKDWCDKCGKLVFKNPEAQRQHKFNQLYIMGAVAVGLGSLVYFFMELILKPIIEG
jgi:hypothetical protein